MAIQLITRAAASAGEAHVRHRRKASDDPYVNHLLRVGHEAANARLTAEAIAAGYLHDTVEDTTVTLDELKRHFPARVTHLVRLLSKWWPEDSAADERARHKAQYYAQIMGDPEAIELKLIDRGDNLRDMARWADRTPDWAESYFEKTKREVTPIFQKSVNDYVRQFYVESLRQLEIALA